MPRRVVDLFCGAGGFSEGFRQAGFDIVAGVDNAETACRTFALNHPGAEVINEDIRNLDVRDLPDDIDVLIGSPPCQEFSSSKKGGNGDVDKGLELVYEFLRIVDERDPDYWVMENVPRLDRHLPCSVERTNLGSSSAEGQLTFEKEVLSSERFGTPQRRKRLFSGRYPLASEAEEEPPTLGDVLDSTPSPNRQNRGEAVEDPNYEIKMEADEFTDQFYNCFLTVRQAEEISRRKEDHSFYGPMSFPDDRSRPARTVMARRTRIARENIVVPAEDPPEGYSDFRELTLREASTIQGFPFTYQFEAGSLSAKWRLVGNAVPPPVARSIAKSILLEEGAEGEEDPRFEKRPVEVDLNHDPPGRRFKLPLTRPFRHHVPYDSMEDFRIDLETEREGALRHPLDDAAEEGWRHPVVFRVRLYKGYAKSVSSVPLSLYKILELLDEAVTQHLSIDKRISTFTRSLRKRLGEELPDATTLQAIRAYRADESHPVEYEWLEEIDALVDEHLPTGTCGETSTEHPSLLGGTELPVRTLVKALGATYVANKLNRCSRWIRANPEQVYVPEAVTLNRDVPSVASSLRCGPCIDDKFDNLADNLLTAGRNGIRLDLSEPTTPETP